MFFTLRTFLPSSLPSFFTPFPLRPSLIAIRESWNFPAFPFSHDEAKKSIKFLVSLPNCRHFGQLGTACTKPAKISDTNYKITLLSNDRRIRKVRNVLSLQCVVTRAPNLLYGVRLYALQGVVTAAQLDKMYEEQTRNAFYRIDAN